MKKIVFVLCLLFFATKAYALVQCSEDNFGNVNCFGINSNGEYVNTHSNTDSFGNTDTFGTIGNKDVRVRSNTDSFGNTNFFSY